MSDVTMILAVIFVLGYLAIIFEEFIQVHKAASALATGIFSWFVLFIMNSSTDHSLTNTVNDYLGQMSQLLFFLIGAMLIVETMDAHKSFEIIGELLPRNNTRLLFCLIMVLSFLISSILDNLTTLIIFVCLLRKLITDKFERSLFLAPLVVSVNAGGAWTPIGDVTTTMLWIDQKISTLGIMKALFIPSVLFMAVFILLYIRNIPKTKVQLVDYNADKEPPAAAKRVLLIGLGTLILVPVFKGLLQIPPYIGMMFGLTVLWIITDLAHFKYKDRRHLRVFHALGRIDMSTILFFFGILLAVDALETVGTLSFLSDKLFSYGFGEKGIAIGLGLISSLIDNVPLVASCIHMFSATQYPQDALLWTLVAFAGGVGGSLLIIGSAPGVALMSMESVSFWEYLKKITIPCLIAFLIAIYLIN